MSHDENEGLGKAKPDAVPYHGKIFGRDGLPIVRPAGLRVQFRPSQTPAVKLSGPSAEKVIQGR